MRTPTRLALALLTPLAGCADDHAAADASMACADPGVISLPACESGSDRFSDEACTVLDDAIARTLTTDTARAPAVTAPTQDQVLSGATPFTFAWSAPTAWRTPPRRPMTWRDELARWTTLIPEAQAHCVPFTGQGYELRFSAGGAVIFRRQQSLLSYTPDASRWAALRAASAGGRAIELRVITARLNSNQLGAGPFVASEARRFTISN